MAQLFPLRAPVHAGSRFPLSSSHRLTLAELAALISCGAAAAVLANMLDFSLRIPGHAILRSVVPMALGVALVPRRFAGTTMALSALATLAPLRWGGAPLVGAGAMTSLLALGPCLDAALIVPSLVRSGVGRFAGWPVILGLGLAGLLCNLLAFLVRGAIKSNGTLRPLERSFAEWSSTAIFTYGACGLLAGIVSGLIFFRLSPKSFRDHAAEPPA